ncbi:MAG TPA: HAMP domain-containing sensor histidine kinase [Hyphomicrobiaceae bacterium]|nr:HAMP domain-containing sensor histidine kinase [Hyphomicrobiaceae bacterium]
MFAAAIAHDLGTPITRLHLRAHEIEDDDTRTRMLSDLNQMRRMITATLDLIRLDLAEPVEAIDLASLVQSLCDDLTDAGEDVTVVALAMVTIRSKPTALRRALVNVLENAIKYGARARVQLTCTADDVLIYIDDDGPGIPDGLMEAAFQPFRRLTNDPDQNDGTGVGLSIARSIVRGVGGEITLTNGTVGLRVTVRLPRTYL